VAALTANGVGTCGADDNQAQAGHLIAYAPEVAATLSRGSAASEGVNPPGRRQEDDTNLVVTALTTRAGATFADQQIGQLVVGVDLQNVALTGDLAGTLTRPTGGANRIPHVVGILGDQAHTLTADGSDASEDGTGRGTPVVAFHMTQDPISGDIAPAMGAGNKQGCATIDVQDGVIVRRLTPLECERLQGAPDRWTDVDDASDSARYRQMGNSVAVPVLAWVLGRLVAVDAALNADGAVA
jgi:DNA (cytosine-5)-methyltransferase 1